MSIDRNNQSIMLPAGAPRLGRCSGSGAAAPLLESTMQASIRDQLDAIDTQYPNLLRMPKDVSDKYSRLSSQLIADVWQARLADHGSIHSHLATGEKDGQ